MKKVILSITMVLGLISVAQAADKSGKELAAKCVACHGNAFEKAALGKSAVVKGQKSDMIEKSLKEYKTGTKNVNGMGAIMKGQTASLSDKDMKTLSTYISEIK